MNFIDNIKILIFCALSLVGHLEARSVSQYGDVRVEQTDDGKFICDKLECPADAFRCYVTKSNEKDPAVLVRTNICYSKDDKPLAEKVTTTATDPKNKIRAQVNSYRNGGMSIPPNSLGNTDPDFDEEKFQKEMKELDEHLNEMNKQMQENLENEMKELDEHLKEMNKQMQENLENEMKQLEENLNNMQHDLDHIAHLLQERHNSKFAIFELII